MSITLGSQGQCHTMYYKYPRSKIHNKIVFFVSKEKGIYQTSKNQILRQLQPSKYNSRNWTQNSQMWATLYDV